MDSIGIKEINETHNMLKSFNGSSSVGAIVEISKPTLP